MCPLSVFRYWGTSACTLVPVSGTGERPNVPSFRFLVPGNIRQNHPCGNHPFAHPRCFSLWACFRNQEKGVLAKGVSAELSVTLKEQKYSRILGPAVTQSATLKRGVHSCKNLLKKTVSWFQGANGNWPPNYTYTYTPSLSWNSFLGRVQGKEKHININKFAGLSRDCAGGKCFFLCVFSGHSLWERKNT